MMKLLYASEYRAAAREALRGRWLMAVLVGLVASILTGGGASAVTEPAFSLTLNLDSGNYPDFSGAASGLPPELYYAFTAAAGVFMAVAAVLAIVFLLIGGSVLAGYAQFNMKMANREPAGFTDLFAFFRPGEILRCFLTNLIQTVITVAATLIGALLFIIPGIVAAIWLTYSFRMTFYILADHPEYGPWQAVKTSYDMMRGHKFRLFCLDFSFIGWSLLCGLTCGIGNLFLTPYVSSAESIFYLELAGDYYGQQYANPEIRY